MALDGAVIRVSLLSVLSAWGAATVVLAAVYAVRSLDRIGRVMAAAAIAAAPAMLIPPAALLLSGASPGAIGVGVALILNATRLLVSHGNAEKKLRRRRKSSGKQRFFVTSETRLGMGPAVAGALTLQAGLGAIWGGYPLAAALLLVAAAGIWTICSIKRGANTPGAPRPILNGALSALLTFLLATFIAVREFGKEPEQTYNAGLLDSTVHLWNRMAFGEIAQPPEAKQKVTTVVTRKPEVILPGSALVPGVIFRPDVKRDDGRAALFVAPSVVGPISVDRPITMAFTGEYHLFPMSSGGVHKDATVYRGTPLDAEYINTSGGALETEARQRMEPPIDLRYCGAIRVKLRTGERSPALALMQLIAEGQTVDLGSEVFALEGRELETLEFTVPPGANSKAREIRLVFRRDPARRNHSAKVAVEGFVLLPRTPLKNSV